MSELKNTKGRVSAVIKQLIETLEQKIAEAEPPLEVTLKRQHAEILAWERAIERSEELHEQQLRFWANLNDMFFWRKKR
jgi:hypothetical protein